MGKAGPKYLITAVNSWEEHSLLSNLSSYITETADEIMKFPTSSRLPFQYTHEGKVKNDEIFKKRNLHQEYKHYLCFLIFDYNRT